MNERLEKVWGLVVGVVMTAVVLTGVGSYVMADTGARAAVREEVGNSAQTFGVQLSTGRAAVIVSTATNRPDLDCRNATAYTILLSTAANSSVETDLYPVGSSETFRIGSFAGAVFGQVEASAGGANQRIYCWAGITE